MDAIKIREIAEALYYDELEQIAEVVTLEDLEAALQRAV